MFKLESYLTPLILNYVDKYIKNLKPEDSQFSLWGGDAVFCNLDLRLDVLEQELQLPFTFVNGHIHELRIHIPWTKLGSEPVVITINTIECILKLSSSDDSSECDSQKIIQSKRSYSSQNERNNEMTEAPPGYVQSLINRVISNICIICNNLILKYVEDDVVLSLNIKSVELLNVNDKWEKAFVDPNVTDTIIRKVIHMQDLTVCLDKRDASGKIETYQDPLLYRCSTSWRLYSVYNSPLSKYPILTRIHMFCENVEFSLTDQQLPMFLRLLSLCVALQNRSTFKDKENTMTNEECSENQVVSEDNSDSLNQRTYDESWGSWAWSFVPEVPVWYSTNSEELEKESNVLLAEKVIQFGIFIGKASCTLKQTMIGQDIFSGSPKCSFTPLMVSNFYGCSVEFTLKGKDFLNIQAGVTGATLTGLEDCVCGHADFINNDNERKVFLKSGVPPSSGHAYSYLSSTLFDPLAPENRGQSRKYNFNHDEHYATLTEEVMVQRFPAFAFDYLYELEIPDEWQDRLSAITTLFLEESNWRESSICRFVFGPLCIDVTSSFIHRLSKLLSSVQEYDYPPYTQLRKISVPVNNVNDNIVEELEEFVPSRQYHLTLFKPVIRLFTSDHAGSIKTDTRKGKRKKIKFIKIPKGNDSQMFLEIYAECIDFQAIVPMYPCRLVSIASNHSSQKLLHHCYCSNSVKLFGLEISLQIENEKMLSESSIIQRASLTFFMKNLMLPESWRDHNDLTLKEYSFECSNISVQLCEMSFLAIISIYQSWTIQHLNTVSLQALKTAVLTSQTGPQHIFGELHDIRCSFLETKCLSCFRASVASVSAKFQNKEKMTILFHAPESTHGMHKGINFTEAQDSFDNENWRKLNFLQLLFQIPKELDSKLPPFFLLCISGSSFCLEPALLSWLSTIAFPNLNFSANLDAELFHPAVTDLENDSTCSSATQEASGSQTLTKSHSTALAGGKSYALQKKFENILFEQSKFLSNLVLDVEIGSLCVLLPHSPWSLHHTKEYTILQSWKNAAFNGSLNQDLILIFPILKIRNNNSVSTFDENPLQCAIPIKNFTEEKKGHDCFPWNVQINCFCAYAIKKDDNNLNVDYTLQPASISATIALTLKNNQNHMGLCVHMDSKFLGISLSASRTALIIDCLNACSTVFNFAEKFRSWISSFHLKFPDMSESDSINLDVLENTFDTPLKDDLPCNTVTEDDLNADFPKKLTLWSQLTLSKLSIILLGKLLPESKFENFKVHFEAEEIISSLDMQDVYSKIKIKLTSLNGNSFTSRYLKQDWNPSPYDGIILFCNDMMPKAKSASANNSSTVQHSHAKSNNQSFLVATYTRALCANAKAKWTSKQSPTENLEGLEYISEIDLKVKSFDLILWMSLFDVVYQIFFPFIKLIQSANSNQLDLIAKPKYPAGINFCSQKLPLLYIETSIIKLYLPENSVLTLNHVASNTEENNACMREKLSNVLLLQVDYVTLTSQVENPLPRIILDSELYNAALNSKSISLPGAAIEDRQYQIDINGLALGSVSGWNMLSTKNPKKDLVLPHPLTMGENPALEWNIGVIPESRNTSNDSAIVIPIISPLNIRIAVAPAIVYFSPCKTDKKNVIVAGISIEVSVNTDICLYLSINQSCFIYTLLKTNLKFLFDILSTNLSVNDSVNSYNQLLEEDVFIKKDIKEFPFIIPPCFTHSSTSSCIQSCKVEKSEKYDFVPFEVLVTAGTVSVMFYYHDNCAFLTDTVNGGKSPETMSSKYLHEEYQLLSSKSFKGKSEKMFDNFEKQSSYNNINQPLLHPFLCIYITEPHSFFMCHPHSQKFESSCFDLQLWGSPSDYLVQKPHESCMLVNDDFLLSYLETKPGEPKAKTGIPPSFFTVSCSDFFNYPAKIEVCVERPVKFNIRPEIYDSTLHFIQHFQSQFEEISEKHDIENKNDCEIESAPNYSDNLNILKYLKNIHLNFTQIVCELSPSLDDNCEKLCLTSGSLKVETGIETYKGGLKCLDLNMDMTEFTLQIYSSTQTWTFLQPLSFSLQMRYHLNPWFQVELRLLAESLLFNLSFHNMLKLKCIFSTLQEHLEKQIEKFKDIIRLKESEEFLEDNLYTETKRRRIWSDDLRKGSFQFIQACEDHDCQPKVQEVVFNRASSNMPASMTWCYPEPRALSKIEISPVPFQCEEGKCIKDSQVLTCYLQYWSSAQQEYLNVCDFMLSETQHCCLDLPDLNSDTLTVSDKWRVLLDCKSFIGDDGVLEVESPCLSPLALAACMSIDSCFDPSLIPVLEIQASFELFKITFYNHFDMTGCTPHLHPFEFDDTSPQNQEFSLVSFINPCVSCTKWSSKLKFSYSSGVICEVLEYRNLTMLPVISPVDIHCIASVNFFKEKGPVYDVDLVLHPCFFRITQSVIHTLNFSAFSILQDLTISENNHSCSEYVLPNYYLICNNIHESIRLGQMDTEEYIILSPLKIHAYSWWCHKKKQMLRISMGSSRWKWSQPFSIDEIGKQAVTVDSNFTVIIEVKELSNLQKQVIIDGQLKIHSQLSFPLQLKCDFMNYSSTKSISSNTFIKSVAPKSCTPAFLLSADQCKQFKVSVTGIIDSQSWSEDIFYGDNKLIKVPWKSSFQKAWCHVGHQKLDTDTFIIAVFICPMFILRSNLPIPLITNVIKENGNEEHTFELTGKGKEVNLQDCDWDEKLQLVFESHSELKVSVPPITINASKLSNVSDQALNINECLQEFFCEMQPLKNKIWPYSILERVPVTYQDFLYPCFDLQNDFIPAMAVRDVYPVLKVDQSQRWSGLNTILIDVKPSSMLVNRLQTELLLFDEKGLQWILPPTSVAILSRIHEGFYLGIKLEEKYIRSSLLYLNESSVGSDSEVMCDSFSFCLNSPLSIPHNGSVNILLKETSLSLVALVKLKSEVHEGIHIFTALPVITVLNKSAQELNFALTLLPSDENNVDFPDKFPEPVTVGGFESCKPLLLWTGISLNNSTIKHLKLNFYMHLSLYASNCQLWSNPLCLHSMLLDNNRHTLSLPIKNVSTLTTIPMVMSSHKWKGMLFLVINNDPSPLLLLHNQTNMDIFYGQSIPLTEGKYVYEELQKHKTIPVLLKDCSAHYSFPAMQDKFPAIDKMPMLCLGLKSENDKYIWSIPFRTNTEKQFVHILGVCDFMIHCKQIGHTVYLYIDLVNRIEITAKEVRSRIAMATDSNVSSAQNNDFDSSKSKSHSPCKKSENKSKLSHSKPITKESSSMAKIPFILYMNIRVVHISFIMCDELKEKHKSVEVFRLNIDNAIFFSRPKHANSSYQLQEVFLCFEHIQLDNQMDNENNLVYDFPVILHRHTSIVPKSETHENDIFLPNKVKENSVFILNAVIELPFSQADTITVQSMNVSLLPISICIEDTFYYKVLNLFKSYTPMKFHKHSPSWSSLYFPSEVTDICTTFITPVHFQELKINIPEVTLSLHASLKLYLSLENSVLKFQPFEKEDIFSSSHEIGRAFVLHYLTGALFRAGWVVGSLDLLGNPAGFARAVGAGMSDFVYLPYKGLFRGPRAFISGLSSGAVSLFTQISSGAIICMASLASSISRNMDFLCLDDEHLARQEHLRHHLPQGISEGLLQGLSGLGLSLLSAVAGIADHPLQALICPTTPMKTASGIVSGLGKGIVGVFTKPIGGAAELLSQTGYGFLHGAGWLTPSKRQYQPITMSLNVVPSSCLKYACKITHSASLGEVLVSLEATYVHENGDYEKNILLLTSEALCILAEDEITMQRTFALSEIRCKKAESDQSTLVVIPSAMYQKQVFMESGGAVERVVEYIIKNREENAYVPQDDFGEFLSKSTSSCHIFYMYPRDRSLFLTLFSFAKSKAMGKGFFPQCQVAYL